MIQRTAPDYYSLVGSRLDELQNSMKNDIINIDNLDPAKSPSTLALVDLMMIFTAGFIGGAFSSSEKIEDFFIRSMTVHLSGNRRAFWKSCCTMHEMILIRAEILSPGMLTHRNLDFTVCFSDMTLFP